MSEPQTLPPCPVDDFILDQIDHALGGAIGFDDDGARQLVGADFSLSQLLDFLSGVDDTKAVLVEAAHPDPLIANSIEGAAIYESPGRRYSEHDLIAALVTEIRRLRALR